MMFETFFVLWIWAGSAGGRSQTIATDHYATLAKCEAARSAILSHAQQRSPHLRDEHVACLEVTVPKSH